jgi:hypothetical protein
MTTYTYHQDPGHGWIEVPLSEVDRLGIRPSPYSYRTDEAAYLEEDCDAGLFIEAKKAKGEPYQFREVHSNRDSFIRNLNRFARATA